MNPQSPMQPVPPQVPTPTVSPGSKKPWVIGGVVLAVFVVVGVVLAVFAINQPKNSQTTDGANTPNSLGSPSQTTGQTDNQRKLDVSRVLVAINNYMANNRGILPTADMVSSSKFAGTGGGSYVDTTDLTGTIVVDQAEDTTDNLNVHLGVDCKGMSGQHSASVSIRLVGTGAVYCDDTK